MDQARHELHARGAESSGSGDLADRETGDRAVNGGIDSVAARTVKNVGFARARKRLFRKIDAQGRAAVPFCSHRMRRCAYETSSSMRFAENPAVARSPRTITGRVTKV